MVGPSAIEPWPLPRCERLLIQAVAEVVQFRTRWLKKSGEQSRNVLQLQRRDVILQHLEYIYNATEPADMEERVVEEVLEPIQPFTFTRTDFPSLTLQDALTSLPTLVNWFRATVENFAQVTAPPPPLSMTCFRFESRRRLSSTGTTRATLP